MGELLQWFAFDILQIFIMLSVYRACLLHINVL